ncbi:MAG: nitrous oxide-stimulated promoter family protein [Bacteroidaceae bacterium]
MFKKQNRIANEQQLVCQMIAFYCRHKHRNKSLCDKCKVLQDYALKRLSSCPYGEAKPSCKQCSIHCYQKEMKSQIQEVMKWAGPRIFFFHPILTLRHFCK